MKQFLLIPVGLIMIFASPFILWSAESQNRAKDFESAKEVNADSEQEGYILIKGVPEAKKTLTCPEKNEDKTQKCIYVSYTVSEYQRKEEKVCSAAKPKETILKELKAECDANGDNCKPCYQIENFEWVNIESKTESVEFSVGKYTIPSTTKANIQGATKYEESIKKNNSNTGSKESQQDVDDIVEQYFYEDDEEYTDRDTVDSTSEETAANEDNVGDKKVEYYYITADSELVIAGESKDGEIYKKDKTFVISADSYTETLSSLQAQDSASKWGLRIVSLFLMIFGFMTVAGGIAAIPLALVNLIPMVGDNISNFAKGVVSFVAGVIGGLLWILTFVLIIALKNIVALFIIIAILGVIGYAIYMKISSKKQEKPQTIG